jgi:BirA family biotin operon repressor/biotin-[acetyl-CoA-carboxylase] ligase
MFESLPSTNGWALGHADSLQHGDALCAIRQTAGHGRFERKWISPADRGLTVTILLRPPRRADWMAQRSGFAAALAVRGMLAAFGLPACVKWPNDVLVGGRKIAGVLAEREGPDGPVALGIGVNVNLTRTDFRGAKLLYPATSMRLEAGRKFVVADVCRGLLDGFDAWWLKMKQQGPQCLRRAWARHDFLRGRIVTVSGPAGSDTGRYAGMDEEGRLALRLAGGETRLFWSGDVSVTPES